jgi:hypothetical protein
VFGSFRPVVVVACRPLAVIDATSSNSLMPTSPASAAAYGSS